LCTLEDPTKVITQAHPLPPIIIAIIVSVLTKLSTGYSQDLHRLGV